MREFVLNEMSLRSQHESEAEAIAALDSIVRGIAALVRASVAATTMRASRPLHDIVVAPELDLWRLAQAALRNPRTKSSAILFLSISHRAPIEEGLDGGLLGRLLLTDLVPAAGSGATALVLCALTGGIAVGFPTEPRWDVDRLPLRVLFLNEDGSEIVEPYLVDHLAREAHAAAVAERHRANAINGQTPAGLWESRAFLFPHLWFGLDVEDHLRVLGPEVFREASQSLCELDQVAAAWQRLGAGRPPYTSKVSGESAPTMQQYGNQRVFRDRNGDHGIYELHSRLHDGFRIHIREVLVERRIEIGYVGRHFPTKKF